MSLLYLIYYTNIYTNRFRHFINKDFILKSYLLGMRDLNNIHLGLYMNLVLLETLKEYNIKYNITR
jgi:hypothetical protein